MAGASEPPPEKPLIDRFFQDWYGNYVLAGIGVVLLLLIVRGVVASATSVSRYGQNLDRMTRKAIKKYEDSGNLRAAGDLLFSSGVYEDAAEVFSQAGEFVRAAEAWEKAGNTAKAVSSYKRGNAPEAAAELLYRKKQFQAAAKEYLAVDLVDKAATAFFQAKEYGTAADLFVKLKRWKEAGDCLERNGQKPKAAEMWILHFNEQYDLARGNLQSVRPACELAQKAAHVLEAEGQGKQAADVLRKAGFLREAADLYQKLGLIDDAARIYLEAKKPMQAAKLYDAAGDKEKAYRYRAEALAAKGDKAAAADDYARAGENIKAAEIYLELGERLKAAVCYEAARDYRSAADLYASEGNHAEAAAALERGGEPEAAMAVYRRLGDPKNELRLAKQAGNYFRVGEILFEHGKKEDALAAFQRVDAGDDRAYEAGIIQGDILRDLGRLDVAFAKYKAAVGEASPHKGNVDVFYRMADCAEAAGSLPQALQLFDAILGVDYYFRDAADRATALRNRVPAQGSVIGSVQAGALPGATVGSGAVAPVLSGGLLGATPTQAGALIPAYVRNAGQTPPRYEIIEEIARGGMGIVYKARDTVLDRIIAYKVLSRDLKANETAVKYFLREARAAAKMTHPNIVTVFDAGEQDGELFMAMEYVEGQTLKSLLQKGPFPEKLLRYVFKFACTGLGYAHAQGLVHRDVKPGNMMLTRDRILKIMDFGLAKFVEEVQAQHTRAIGTPYYMSPEQIVGQELDPRSDIYSLGVSMFECATGQVPFAKGDLSYHHLNTAPPTVLDLNPQLSQEISDIILRCMQKRPDDRFSSTSELQSFLK